MTLTKEQALNSNIEPHPLSYPLSDYHKAMTEGPLHFTWQDKPHRLVYDLIAAVKYYYTAGAEAKLAELFEGVEMPEPRVWPWDLSVSHYYTVEDLQTVVAAAVAKKDAEIASVTAAGEKWMQKFLERKQELTALTAERDALKAETERLETNLKSWLRANSPDGWIDELRVERDALASKVVVLREALKFYADKDHFVLGDEDAWDTVSGEPQNYWCDEAGTATVEDGSRALAALEATK